MPISMQQEQGNIFRLDVHGTLRKADLTVCQDRLAGEMARLGPVKLLFVLQEFAGWEPNPDWSDFSFYIRHGNAIEAIAIVGPERWRSESLMFAGADLRSGPVQFFPETAAAEAYAWLQGTKGRTR